MNITEIFPLSPSKAERLFWTPGYVSLSQEVALTYRDTGETSELVRHTSNCASRWGISRRCARAILNGEGTYNLTDDSVIITRPVVEE